MPAGGQPLLALLSRAGAASSSGSRSILAELLRKPEPSPELKHGGALAPSPALGAPPSLPSPRQGGSRSDSAPKAAGGVESRGRLAPHSPNPDRAAWVPGHPRASPPPLLLPLLLPCSHRGDGGTPRGGQSRTPTRHTHTFQWLYPSESRRLENSSYSSIFIFFGYHFSFGHVIN